VKLFRDIPLRRAWYALILLSSLLPALALSPWLSEQAHSLLLDRAMLRETLFHQQLETHLYLETKRLLSVLQNKSDPIVYFMRQGGHQKSIMDLLKKIDDREAVVNTTTIYDPRARVLLSSREGDHVGAVINQDSPAFVIPMHQRVFIGSPVRLSDQHYEFLIAVPLVADGQSLGVMVSTININNFWQNIKSRLPQHDSQVYLIDGRGSLLIQRIHSHVKQGDLLSEKPIVRALLAHKDWHSPKTYSGFEGTQVFGIGTHVRELQWGLISEISSHNIMSPIFSALITLTMIVVVIHLLFGLFALIFSSRLIYPISALASVMKRAAGGDYSQHVKASRYREIDDLGNAFRSMLEQIDKREKTLKKLHLAIEHLGEAIMITDRDGVIEYVNAAFTQMNGYGMDEVRGMTPQILNSGTQTASFYRQFWSTIKSGEVWEGRLINRKKDGTLYPVLMSVAPIFEGDEIIHFVAVQQNMDEQDQLENQLRQSQKMESIGTMVGGIAHNFNNMLAGMTGNLYLAKLQMREHPEVMQKLTNVEELSGHAAEMIQQLLAFARKGMVSMKEMPLVPFIRETLKLLHASVPENIAVHQDICSEALQVKGDATLLHQVLVNLVNNARDAVENADVPSINIRLASFHTDDDFIEKHPYVEPGAYAHLSVADNGIGVPEHQLERLFEPFFTTKEQGRGTGLGLSMVFGAIKTHHGFVDVESRIGEGATFHVYIPLLQATSGAETGRLAQHQAASGMGELILLVDDEQHVRQTTAEVLEALGYRVLQADDGLNAAELFKQHRQEIDLIITDVVMPRCGGIQLAEGVRKERSRVSIIFVTGYDRQDMLGEAEAIDNCEIISKPVQFDDLSCMIRRLIG